MILLLAALARAMREPILQGGTAGGRWGQTVGKDFRDTIYFPVKELLAGGNPYDPQPMFAKWPIGQEFDLYTPLHLLLHLPFVWMPYHTALVVYCALGCALFVGSGVLAGRAAGFGWPGALLIGDLLLLSQAGKANVYNGQVNALICFGYVLAMTSSNRAVAAVGLALVWIKPQFAIPLVVLLLVRRRGQLCAQGTVIAFLLSLPVLIALLRSSGVIGFVEVLQRNLAYATTTTYGAVDSLTGERVDGAAVLYRLTHLLPPGAEFFTLIGALGITALVLLRGGGTSARRVETEPRSANTELLIGLTLLVAVVHQPGDSFVLIVGLAALIAEILRRSAATLTVIAGVLAVVPYVHIGRVSTTLEATGGQRFDGLVDGLALLLAWLLVIAQGARRPTPTGVD